MSINDAYLLYILNDGMAENIPKMVQMTTAMLETPQAPRQNPANAQTPVPQTGMRPKNTPNLAPKNPEKQKIRRAKTTIRERNRMRTLGEALDTLRDNIPITTKQQKLSKIETLRLARNYIEALQKMLQTNEQPTPLQYVHTLANGLSPTTTNMLADMWQVEPGLLAQTSQLHKSSDCCSSSQNGLLSHHSSSDPQPRSTTSYSTPMSSHSPPQHYYSLNQPLAAYRETITEWSEHHHM
ncbi:hypothetical protein CAEBREN_04483 [Caenorhabditis brenneri]|uniref:BHLH domain-containing protein n=1 Tax=Caenorhabditis brenneri TaxID=135651 RepID=G0NHZ0_CAEBE|nr:hypothetical protein CAEBREN_04483 [Caenorhabditis brenneri]